MTAQRRAPIKVDTTKPHTHPAIELITRPAMRNWFNVLMVMVLCFAIMNAAVAFGYRTNMNQSLVLGVVSLVNCVYAAIRINRNLPPVLAFGLSQQYWIRQNIAIAVFAVLLMVPVMAFGVWALGGALTNALLLAACFACLLTGVSMSAAVAQNGVQLGAVAVFALLDYGLIHFMLESLGMLVAIHVLILVGGMALFHYWGTTLGIDAGPLRKLFK